jgi:PAS domain S-box-containing protein
MDLTLFNHNKKPKSISLSNKKSSIITMEHIYLLLAGIIYAINGYVYYSSNLIGFFVLLINIFFAVAFIVTVILSLFIRFFDKHLFKILQASLYLIMVQSIFESSTYKHDFNHIIGLLVIYMVCSMPFKSNTSLYVFLAINFLMVSASTFFVENPLMSNEVIILAFFTGGVVSVVSIGSRLRTQQKLKQNEQFFKDMFNESAGANFLTDLQSMKTVSCNKKAIEMFEASDENELNGVDIQLFQLSTFSRDEMEAIKTELKDNWGWSREIEFKTLTGQTFWGNLEYRIVQFQNNSFLQIRITDISERIRLEQLLRAEKATLELASQTEGLEKPVLNLLANIEKICPGMRCALLFYDEHDRSLSFGYSSSLNRTFVNNLELYSMNSGTGLTNTAAMTRKPVELNELNMNSLASHADGLININHLVACHAYPILSETDTVLGVLAVYFYDHVKRNGQELEMITRMTNICRILLVKEKTIQENKNYLNTLQVKNNELKKTNDELDRFVYSTSHDLRVPLTNVMGLIDITEMSINDEAPKKYLALMRQSVVALDDVIRGILDYSRNARAEISMEEVNIRKMVDDVKEAVKYHHHANAIDFRIFINEQIPLYTDKQRLFVILNNLVSNAIKYFNQQEAHPFISIVVQINTERALIFIEDNGIGIPEAYHEKVFEMFYRASSQANGSGLGLYILKETLNRLNGKISVVSGADIGTTFIVEIPNHINEYNNKAIA